jgi:kynurenine formamidase
MADDSAPQQSFPTYADLVADGRPSGTAWGVFGEGDELGTLNHLTPERVRAAAGSIRSGETVSLNLSLLEFDPPIIAHRGAPRHEVFGLNEFHRDDRIDGFFPQASTQLDGLRHFGHPDFGFYNGADPARLVAGSPDLGIQNVARRGIAGRGLLIDVAAFRDAHGHPIDQTTAEHIPVADLEGALEWQGSEVLPGDILLIRTGWLGAVRAPDAVRPVVPRSPGLAPRIETAAWLWDHRVALAAADNIALEAWPPGESEVVVEAEVSGRMARSSHTGMLHRVLIPLLGLTIGELWDLDALAVACQQRGAYDIFVTAEPLDFPGGVGSPANALAIL